MNTVAEIDKAFRSSSYSSGVVPPHASPGFLVFSPSLQLQYVNRRGLDLIQRLGGLVSPTGMTGRPSQVLEFRDHILATLNDRLDAKISDAFEVCRALSSEGTRLHLRGIGCPDPAGGRYSHIIIVLEEVSPDGGVDRQYAVHQERERQITSVGICANA